MRVYTMLSCLVLILFKNYAQTDSDLALISKVRYETFHVKTSYIPSGFIGLGSYSNANKTIINNEAIKLERDENMPDRKSVV